MNDNGGKFGRAQGRIEDHRFLTGAGRFIEDIAPEGALQVLFLRSDIAHGEITALDLTAARALAGVHLVLAAEDLLTAGVLLGMYGHQTTNFDGSRAAAPERPVLAHGRVRHVGEAIAVVVADTIEIARDALELIDLTTRDLPVAMAFDAGPDIHAEAKGNRAFDFRHGDAAALEAGLATAAHRVSLRVVHNRIIVNPMETRGAWAEWDGARLHLAVNGQGVWKQKAALAQQLGLRPEAVRVTNPDVGGGFGMKAMAYPEYIVLGHLARALGRPVVWVASRTEGMLTDNAGRDLIADIDAGFDKDLRIIAYGVNLVSNLGAYNSEFGQGIQSELFLKVLTGVYDIAVAHFRAVGVYTNTAPVDAYRGAGRPEAILTIERLMDHAARELGVDPFDLRQRNVITQFPYAMMSGETVDCGDFAGVLQSMSQKADMAGYTARVETSKAKGLLRGVGLCSYIEAILGESFETARVVLVPGGAELYVGTQSNGQGHETVFARLLSEQTGLPIEAIRFVQGDSDRIAYGGGTGGSRSVTVQGTAIRRTSAQMIAAYCDFLAQEFGAPVVFDDGHFAGAGNLRLGLMEAADLARDKGRADLLDHSAKIKLDGRSFPNGAHLAEVEIDPETGALRLDRYTVVDDFGTLIAPELVLGQVHGGIAQGFGQAVCENAVYDAQGQLLTASFMDYAMPRADDLPMIGFTSRPVPTVTNPLGMKGCGEAGTVGALAAVSNAVRDALAPRGVAHVEMPFTPQRIWQWLQEADSGLL